MSFAELSTPTLESTFSSMNSPEFVEYVEPEPLQAIRSDNKIPKSKGVKMNRMIMGAEDTYSRL
jgi:hypothetical protein